MTIAITYTFISVIIVSLVAVVAALPLLIWKKTSKRVLLILLSISVGTLLGSVFIHFLPEAMETGQGSLEIAIYILTGFLAFFMIEKLIHWHHHKDCVTNKPHNHAYHLAPMNLIGDGIHNFLDGLVIAGAYAVNIPLGIAATISVIFHEVPQEIADFGVLLYSGLSKKKALLFNFMSALTALAGAFLGIILAGRTTNFTHFIIPFAAGSFIYIAASNLVPELHRDCRLTETMLHLISIIAGVGIMVLIALFTPEHIR
ncbi:ZIP family metal transporter [archaeon]|jgi:zinc and cadmium transporter|nr:ZIP family metal transporter [archaeon]MBT3451681.1 ZIP family metal transporter [archaeon]MBT6869692.1 ZIP family metal transporter [archaeon]MBT7193207.1 ZIP family metal transporter [archaeon]MBT7380452.1 ZIP family metal transporter [archaeon]